MSGSLPMKPTQPATGEALSYKAYCGANEKGQRLLTTHIWQEYLDIVEAIRKTDLGKRIYARQKETIERVFADAKEKPAMRYTHHRGLAAVTRWVRLKLAAILLSDQQKSRCRSTCKNVYSFRRVISLTKRSGIIPISKGLFRFL